MNNSIDRDSWTWKLCVRCLLQRKSYQCILDIRQGSESVIEERLMSSFMDVMKRFHLARSPPPVSLSVYLWASSLCLRNAGGGGVALGLPRPSHGFQSKISIIQQKHSHTYQQSYSPHKHKPASWCVFVSFCLCSCVSHSFLSLWLNTNTNTDPHTHSHTHTFSHYQYIPGIGGEGGGVCVNVPT